MVLPNATLFPHTILPLYIFEPRYRAMLAHALETHRMFSVALQRPDRVRETPVEIAGIGVIRASVENKDGTSHLIVQGLTRIKLGPQTQTKPYRVHEIEVLPATAANPEVAEALMSKARQLVTTIFDEGLYPGADIIEQQTPGGDPMATDAQAVESYKQFLRQIEKIEDPEVFVDAIGGMILQSPAERQVLLETPEMEERLKHLVHFLLAVLKRGRKTGGK